jgi:hypothetical protein
MRLEEQQTIERSTEAKPHSSGCKSHTSARTPMEGTVANAAQAKTAPERRRPMDARTPRSRAAAHGHTSHACQRVTTAAEVAVPELSVVPVADQPQSLRVRVRVSAAARGACALGCCVLGR